MRVPVEWDVLVVGAGPAGSRAAATAATEGARTLLIDAKRNIGEQPHCGEYVTGSLFDDYRLDTSSIIQHVDTAELMIVDFGNAAAANGQSAVSPDSPDSKHVFYDGSDKPDTDRDILWRHQIATAGRIIDRARFDRDLARHAASCQAMVLSLSRFVGFEGDYCIIRTRNEELALKVRCVVAADGGRSAVASSMGLEKLALGYGIQVETPLARPEHKIRLFFCKDFFGGYGWLFPKGKVANVGVGVVLRKCVRPARLLERLLEWLRSSGMILPGMLAHHRGMVPFCGLRPRVVQEHVIFCGDAAGLADPTTGEGITQAVASGDRAGRAAARAALTGSDAPLRTYQESISSLYGETSARSLARREAMLDAWEAGPFESVVRTAFLDPALPRIPETNLSSYLRGT